MLEPDNPQTPTISDPGPSDAAGSETPPRKPRRSPRKASAKKVAPSPDPLADPGEPAPAKRAPAKRALAKQVPGEPVPVEASDEVPAPRKRASRRTKASAAAAPAAAASAESTPERDSAEAGAPPDGDEQLAPVLSAPAVLFVTPEAPAGTRRRRVAPPVEVLAEEVAAEVDEEPEEVREAAAEEASGARRRRRRGRRGRGGRGRETAEATDEDEVDDEAPEETAEDVEPSAEAEAEAEAEESEGGSSRRRRRRRRRDGTADDREASGDDPPDTVVHVREARDKSQEGDGVRAVKGSTRLEAKRQRRRDGRDSGRRRPPILTEAEFLARRESVDRVMAVRQNGERTQIAVLEDKILVEHYVTRASATSYVGNVYLGRVQNVLPSMEAAFVDIGKGRNGVLYAGEVNWDLAGLEGKARAIENALKPGDAVLVQVTKDPIGHKGARLTSQVSLPGRFLVYVPGAGMTGISRKLPDTERHRLKEILKKVLPEDAGVIVRTAAEGASEDDLTHDVERLKAQWASIERTSAKPKAAPTLVYGEPDLAIRVVRDLFNEDFRQLIVSGAEAWQTISSYLKEVAPELADRLVQHTAETDLFHELRVDEQITKALDRKVWLPSGGSLVIDRTEAMTVIDVNTGKYVGSGGNLEQTVTRNNLEAAEEIVRQLRLRDVGGIVVIDFIDMVLESNRELVLRRLTECLGRDRTKHQVAEVTSLGLVQMTRKRVGEGLLEAFSETCPTCGGRGLLVHTEPVDERRPADDDDKSTRRRGRRGRAVEAEPVESALNEEQRRAAASAMATIAGLTAEAAELAAESTPEVPEALAEEPEPDHSPARPPADEAGAPAGSSSGPAPRRRRRAASRPAGPPVTADATAR
jgi:ribonuclease E